MLSEVEHLKLYAGGQREMPRLPLGMTGCNDDARLKDYFFLTTSLVKIVALLAVVLGIMNYAVYAERRISALIQDRLGPNRVGPAGLFQPIADAAKFLLKEDFTPGHVNKFYYWLAPCLAMIPAITTLAVVPFGSTLFGIPMVIADTVGCVCFRHRLAGVYECHRDGFNSKYHS